ncbi:hypothetical protein [Pseudomonas capsici]|uniref:hypothetical protein n=1 Tax=Pseudomonas capsici TaxID=2810614 RepID=UPI000E3C8F99|nr:hypothetical protein [Pseudomonas capsici]MCV4286033.1 hypothetical protein [Pseudomonas capsici]
MPAIEYAALAKSTTATQPIVGVPPKASALLQKSLLIHDVEFMFDERQLAGDNGEVASKLPPTV